MWMANLGSRSVKNPEFFFVPFTIIRSICLLQIMTNIFSGNCPPSDIGLMIGAARIGQSSAKRKGHFALFNCLVLGQTKYKCVQRVYCNLYPVKVFYGSHRMDRPDSTTRH
jgi:hypothetical protein